jgi:UDP-N-acetylmuramoyl-L-alanyl-D-glutamate--2,6-diaminopimelate ligase
MELTESQISYLLRNNFSNPNTLSQSSSTKKNAAQNLMNPILQDLLSELSLDFEKETGELGVTCLITDSRRVVPGALFFAIGGLRTDGNFYVEEAVDRGAIAVVSEQDLGDHLPIPCIRVADVRIALAQIARKFYNAPDERLHLTGVTGTNGKTTVSMLSQYLFGGREQVGLLGTIRYDFGRRTLPSFKTTPESVDVFALLSQIESAGCEEVAMEISSHGIDQRRVYGLSVEVAVFLNLTQDHIDYHKNMEAYFSTKEGLFNFSNGSLPRAAVVNIDCPYGRRLVKSLEPSIQLMTFSLEEEASLQAHKVQLFPDRSEFELEWSGGRISVVSPLLGRYNVSNLLAALAAGLARGFEMEAMIGRLESFKGVPGRMQRVKLGQDFNVLVDYAHTDDALKNACSMLSDLTQNKSIVVFGCGGDRDRTKRAPMLRAVLDGADTVIVTADNPRKESIEQIFDDMRITMNGSDFERVQFIPDRKRAISTALDLAETGDSIMVAGKGHETYQEFDGSVIPFDDNQVIKELWALKTGGKTE